MSDFLKDQSHAIKTAFPNSNKKQKKVVIADESNNSQTEQRNGFGA